MNWEIESEIPGVWNYQRYRSIGIGEKREMMLAYYTVQTATASGPDFINGDLSSLLPDSLSVRISGLATV